MGEVGGCGESGGVKGERVGMRYIPPILCGGRRVDEHKYMKMICDGGERITRLFFSFRRWFKTAQEKWVPRAV